MWPEQNSPDSAPAERLSPADHSVTDLQDQGSVHASLMPGNTPATHACLLNNSYLLPQPTRSWLLAIDRFGVNMLDSNCVLL